MLVRALKALMPPHVPVLPGTSMSMANANDSSAEAEQQGSRSTVLLTMSSAAFFVQATVASVYKEHAILKPVKGKGNIPLKYMADAVTEKNIVHLFFMKTVPLTIGVVTMNTATVVMRHLTEFAETVLVTRIPVRHMVPVMNLSMPGICTDVCSIQI